MASTDKIHIHLTLTIQEAHWLAGIIAAGQCPDEEPHAPFLHRIENQVNRSIDRHARNTASRKTDDPLETQREHFLSDHALSLG